MQKGLVINFGDLIHHLLKKWIVLIVFILVFGLAANVYGYRRASLSTERERRALEEYAQSVGINTEELPEYMTAELAGLKEALTEEEASFVEAVAKLYMYRMWASDKINAELVVGEPDQSDLEMVQTLYYANEGVESATQVMTSAEKSYYNVLVKGLSGTDMSVTENNISSPGFVQPKWILIGCAFGLFIGVCVIAMVYAGSGKLRTASDMEIPFGVPVLAKVKPEDDAVLESVSQGLFRLMKGNAFTSIALAAIDTPEAKAVTEKMCQELKEADITVTEVSGESKDFIGKIAGADTVLFVEQIGKSRYQNIEENVSACRKFCIPTAGCVVIR